MPPTSPPAPTDHRTTRDAGLPVAPHDRGGASPHDRDGAASSTMGEARGACDEAAASSVMGATRGASSVFGETRGDCDEAAASRAASSCTTSLQCKACTSTKVAARKSVRASTSLVAAEGRMQRPSSYVRIWRRRLTA